MTDTWVVIDAAFLLLFASLYLGTGWSLVLFSFPMAPKLTPETYQLPFVDPVRNATLFFSVTNVLMVGAAIAMIVAEAGTEYLWVPIVYLAMVVISAGVTTIIIFPYNREMRNGSRIPHGSRWCSASG